MSKQNDGEKYPSNKQNDAEIFEMVIKKHGKQITPIKKDKYRD